MKGLFVSVDMLVEEIRVAVVPTTEVERFPAPLFVDQQLAGLEPRLASVPNPAVTTKPPT